MIYTVRPLVMLALLLSLWAVLVAPCADALSADWQDGTWCPYGLVTTGHVHAGTCSFPESVEVWQRPPSPTAEAPLTYDLGAARDFTFLSSVSTALPHDSIPAITSSIVPTQSLTGTLILAHYMAWFGSSNHITLPDYHSQDPELLSSQIHSAQDMGIDGFVVDWYGPASLENPDRDFIDQAFAVLLDQAEQKSFKVAICYDQGTLRSVEPSLRVSRAVSDVQYAASQYFTSTAYLHYNDKPVLFVFPYTDVITPTEIMPAIRSAITATIFDEDPDAETLPHVDGFYAWVQPTNPPGWQSDCSEWGEGYLQWFYPTMASSLYSDTITIGGVWPGFDDALASWGTGRCMSRRCGRTWQDTWAIAIEHHPPIIQIDTWNDFEEGTAIEYGVGSCIYLPVILKDWP
jgi:hypothetical protein